MNKKLISVLIIITVLVAIGLYIPPKKEKSKDKPLEAISTENKKTDYTASFAIFTHGTFRIFISPMYHNLSKDVFIQADNPNIVYVKKDSITWDDFFKTLPFSLTKECLITGTGQTFCDGDNGKLRFFLSGIEDPDVLDKRINENDRLLVTFGNESEEEIKNQLQKVPPSN